VRLAEVLLDLLLERLGRLLDGIGDTGLDAADERLEAA
jgi:hypothetical protein